MKILRTVLGCLLAALTVPPAAMAAEKAGDIVLVRGKAVIERAGSGVPARIKAALQETDSVSTLSRSRVKLLFRDDSILTLGANSRLVIRKYLYDPANKRAESLCELADGRLRSVVGSPGFKVATPTAFAAARGTVFTVQFDSETGTTTISVVEGSVEVRNVNTDVPGVQVVSAGQSTTVAANQPPSPPVPSPPGAGDEEKGGGLPGAGGGTGGGLLDALQDQLEKGGLKPPIEQVPAQALSNVKLQVNFR